MKEEKYQLHKPLINPLWITFGTLLLVIIPFLVWAYYANLDQISHAQGQVIATAKTQEIQSTIDGVVEQIYVTEGEHVKKGDNLILLDKAQAQAAYENSKAKVAALKANLSRLRAEVYGKRLIFDKSLDKYPEFKENQKALFRRRQRALNDDLSALNESLKLAREELNLNIPLLDNGDIGALEIIKIRRQIAELKGKISNTRNKYFQDSQTDMTKAEEELSTKEQELADKTIIFERTSISSPMDAIVKNIIVTTKGANVRSGEVILELLPFGDELIIEAKMRPSDISFVKQGQKASVKLDAYDYSIYGVFYGNVTYISPDTLVEKTPKGEEYFFRVLIALDKTQLNTKNGKKINISPGMTAQVDIVTGNRSVLTYLSKPITKTFSEAFHER
ncbi:HlyD family efflux transporter periplasmic adaptor subunit [Poseidonibacter antarcticus]|uniref:HlyD family efflux transporter periplasmic adaptor subunit n=1 Tax=Poseidonibacter antarcticus TaxID=2478538 RepID=UPI000EF49E83|nr:HlyD family efflux transporter periplasmic adaptor subunit [Poseidonibacter antarcticus]